MALIHFTDDNLSITLTLLTKQGNTDEINFKSMGRCFVAGGYAYGKGCTKSESDTSSTNGFNG